MPNAATEHSSTVDILTIEEFADRMKIAERTVWNWIHNGKLKAGTHYMRFDRVIRFAWGAELIQKLHEVSVDDEPEGEYEMEEPMPKRKKRTKGAIPPMDLNF